MLPFNMVEGIKAKLEKQTTLLKSFASSKTSALDHESKRCEARQKSLIEKVSQLSMSFVEQERYRVFFYWSPTV